MRFRISLKYILVLITFLMLLHSCSTSKKTSLPCPDISRREPHSKRLINKSIYLKLFSTSPKINNKRQELSKSDTDIKEIVETVKMENDEKQTIVSSDENLYTSTNQTILIDNKYKGFDLTKLNNRKLYENKNNINSKCDLMTYKDGSEHLVKVIEIGTTEIKFKGSDNKDEPMVVARKSDTFYDKTFKCDKRGIQYKTIGRLAKNR
jgi:hypothetical protein